ncbi:MAG TPA: hypothetical protein VNC50_12645 [Planctomycetia bacterium]|nr:hypothetical protein [Planctomycetia bacterium]
MESSEAAKLILAGQAPANLAVDGDLAFESQDRGASIALPDGLSVGRLDLSKWAGAISFGSGIAAYELDLSNTGVTELPADLQARSRLELADCTELVRLPAGLKVGTLNVRGCTGLVALPEGLDVWFLDVSGCWALEGWPRAATIRGGSLRIAGCVAMTSLPPYVTRLANLDIRHCSNLKSLPEGLTVTGWLDLAHSGLVAPGNLGLPRSLHGTALRWAGAPIDVRIAFEPDSITAKEVLAQANSEVRRAMLDRIGVTRFLQEANARRLDADRDPGGPRELLQVKLVGDEDLVALSCRCPSTGRHYMIRVPPATKTCHQAAAWIAGFDDPNDYKPQFET